MTIRRIRPGDEPLVKAVRLAALKDAPYAFSGTYAAASQREESTWHADAERNSRSDESATFFAFVGDEAIG